MNNLESVCQDLGLELDGIGDHVTKPFYLSCSQYGEHLKAYVDADGWVKDYFSKKLCKTPLGYILANPSVITAEAYDCPINEPYWYISEEHNDRIQKRYNTDTLLDKYNKIYHNMYKTPNINQYVIKAFDALMEEDLRNASESY